MERLNSTVESPLIKDLIESSYSRDWIVTAFDNDTNTHYEVVMILLRATGCSLEEAEIETWEIDNLGKSVVHHGEEDECREAAKIIGSIGIHVEVCQEI